MKIWAIADLHLPFGAPEKTMEAFGPSWKGYVEQIRYYWEQAIGSRDLILIAGDISWAMQLEEAMKDLQWIDSLPGTKVLLKGNHDLWWPSNRKLRSSLPPSIHFIHNNALNIDTLSIGGSRLWNSSEYHFSKWSLSQLSSQENEEDRSNEAKIFDRELLRLQLSLNQMNPHATCRIAMTHYPPIGGNLEDSKVSKMLEAARIHCAVFGHLHHIREDCPLFGEKNGVRYLLTSADYLHFKPILLNDYLPLHS